MAMAMAKKPCYSYPVLSTDDILNILRDGYPELHIDIKDITHPNSRRIGIIYRAILKEIQHTLDNIYMPSVTVSENVEYCEMYEESLPLIAFTMALQNLLGRTGFPDFHIRDILDPRPKRTRRILSVLLNVIKFDSTNIDRFNEVVSHVNSVKNYYETLKQNKQKLVKDVKECKDKLEANALQKAKLQSDLESVKQQLQTMAGQQKLDIQKTVADKKNVILKLIQEAEDKRDLLKRAKAEVEELNRQVVHSPDRLREKINLGNDGIKALSVEITEQNNRLLELQRSSNVFRQWQVDVEHIEQLLNDICLEITKRMELKTTTQIMVNKKQSLTDNLQDMQMKYPAIDCKIKTRIERATQSLIQSKAKLAALQRDLAQSLENECEANQCEQENYVLLSALVEETEIVIQKTADVRKELNDYETTAAKHLDEFMDMVTNRNKELKKGLDEIDSKYKALYEMQNKMMP